jgi:hypothetical protein
VLVIGARIPGVHCAQWLDGDLPNIADFDLLVANEVTLEGAMRVPGKEKRDLPDELYKRWHDRLAHIRARAIRLLKSGGVIMAIHGETVHRHTRTGVSPSFVTSTDWFPLPVAFHTESGDTISVIDQKFDSYMALVARWRFYLGMEDDRYRVRELVDEIKDEHLGMEVHFSLESVAKNRQELPIAAEFYYVTTARDGGSGVLEEARSGPLIVLPAPTRTSPEAAVAVLLGDFAGLTPEAPEPAFASSIVLPGEQDLLEKIQNVDAEADRLASTRSDLQAGLTKRRSYLKLTYEKGIAGLQNTAREAFEELGLDTEEADPEVSDEFVVSCQDKKLLVEVKGHRKGAQKEDIRQLDESLDTYEKKFGTPIKGVLLVNAWCELPPEERETADRSSFSADVIKRAEAIDVALLTGIELLAALSQFWKSELSGDEVFERLRLTAGVASFVP